MVSAVMQSVGKSAFLGRAEAVPARHSRSVGRACLVVRAEQAPAAQVTASRRAALGACLGAAALLTTARPSQAAFGDAANVFGGKPTNTTGFIPYAGDGYALLLPSKWNPSREREAPGVELKYEDNGDNLNNLVVIRKPSDKKSISDYGSPDAFLKEITNLLGQQVFSGETISEGGFAPNRVSAASLLDVTEATDKKGKKYYKYDILTRSADGNEGGKHNLITASVGNGALYILKIQIGDKRWFKGASKDAQGAINSFVVA